MNWRRVKQSRRSTRSVMVDKMLQSDGGRKSGGGQWRRLGWGDGRRGRMVRCIRKLEKLGMG